MRKKYVDFLDHIDGGGAGQTGDSFQGGGLLSALGNIFANPYGSEDEERRAQRRQALGLLDTAAAPARAPAPFAPRTAPPVVPSHLTGPKMGTAPPVVPSHLTGPKMGTAPPVVPSHLTGPKMGMAQPQIPSHLTGPKMGMPPPGMQYPWQGDARFVQIMQQELFSNPNLEYLQNDPQRMQNVYEVYSKYAQQWPACSTYR